MIPVVGIPYLSNPDLLEQCLASLPRDRVGRVHIIDNSFGGLTIPDVEGQVVVTRPHHNVGVAQGWNDVIKWNPFARWWFIINADVAFVPDDLDRLEAAMRIHEVVTLGGMLAFGVRASAITKVGWFDENLVPCYFEDNDWDYRCKLLGVHVEKLGPPAYHFGSATIRRDERYRALNNVTFPQNERYYVEKWGGKVDHEVYTTPFDKGGSPRDWTLEMTRLSTMAWKE